MGKVGMFGLVLLLGGIALGIITISIWDIQQVEKIREPLIAIAGTCVVVGMSLSRYAPWTPDPDEYGDTKLTSDEKISRLKISFILAISALIIGIIIQPWRKGFNLILLAGIFSILTTAYYYINIKLKSK